MEDFNNVFNGGFNAKVGEHIYILDRSYAHYTGEQYDFRNFRHYIKFEDELYRAEAIVIREPYEETIIWDDGTEKKELMFDAYVPSLNAKVTLTASYQDAHAHNRMEMQDIIEYQDSIDAFYDCSLDIDDGDYFNEY